MDFSLFAILFYDIWILTLGPLDDMYIGVILYFLLYFLISIVYKTFYLY